MKQSIFGTNAPLAIGVLVVIGGFFAWQSGLFSDNNNCSSDNTTSTVQRIAIQQLTKAGLGFLGLDVAKTKIDVNAIRTQSHNGSVYQCAASLRYHFVSGSPPPGSDHVPDTQQLENMSQLVNTDVTYKVEKTDDGKSLYVTVDGLKQ